MIDYTHRLGTHTADNLDLVNTDAYALLHKQRTRTRYLNDDKGGVKTDFQMRSRVGPLILGPGKSKSYFVDSLGGSPSTFCGLHQE